MAEFTTDHPTVIDLAVAAPPSARANRMPVGARAPGARADLARPDQHADRTAVAALGARGEIPSGRDLSQAPGRANRTEAAFVFLNREGAGSVSPPEQVGG